MSEQKNVKIKNLTNSLILLLIIATIVYFITKNIRTSSSVILSFVGLGVVIFIHELGHFAAGKLCGIKVEMFAIGFGPIVMGFKRIENYLQIRILPTILEKENDENKLGLLCFRIPFSCRAGETEYQLRIFPIGGFVKLLGQEDLGADKISEDPNSFVNVAIWKRIVTVSAGVTLNVVLAGIFFVIVFMNGINLAPAIIGDVMPGYPAAKAGLKAGDEIVAVDGRKNIDFMNVAFAAALSGKDKPVNLEIKKTNGSIENLNLVAVQIPQAGIKGFGIEQSATLEIAKVDDPKKLDELYGLKEGDVLTAVDGQKIEQFWQLSDKLQNSFEPNISLTFNRPGQTETIEKKYQLDYSGAIDYQESGEFLPSHIFGLIPRLKIVSIELRDVNETLQKDDIIVQVADVTNPTYKELRQTATANAGKELKMVVLRKGQPAETTVTPKKGRDGRIVIGIGVALDVESAFVAQTTDANIYGWANALPRGAEIISIAGNNIKNYFDIARVLNENKGKTVKIKYSSILDNKEIKFSVPDIKNYVQVKPQLLQIPPFKMLRKLYRASGPVNAIEMGSRKTVEFVLQTYMTIKGLITRDISPKSLMGPVGMIAASTKIISERDFMQYLYFMGMISACLAVMNFLPLPIFDGGLVVLLIIEKIKGSPVHEKIQEVLVYIGITLILGLFIVITYNDILRWVFNR